MLVRSLPSLISARAWFVGAPRLAALLLLFLAVVPVHAARAQEVPELQVHSKDYIVVDADTGEVFAQRGANRHAAIASLTKIYTAVTALELAPPTRQMTTDDSDVFDSTSSTVMGLQAGETFSFQDLLYGMLLPSGNDAAHAIARNLGMEPGFTDDQAVNHFVDLTNRRIKDMGLTDTHLVNPHGWGVPNHYSSAHDLAVFTMYALRYPRFVDAISTGSYTTADGQLSFNNSNRMLNLYDGIVGGKTGFDNDAGWCLVEVARRDGSTMISVTLNGIAPDDWYDDDRVLLDYAFDQKAKRLAAHRPITGQVVRFKDPDAAVIARGAESAASLGVPVKSARPTGPTPPGKAVPAGAGGTGSGSTGEASAGAATGSNAASPPGNHGISPAKALAALAVAALLILVPAVGAFRRSTLRRRPEDPGLRTETHA